MRFLADMGVARRIVEWLRAEGHEAAHLREEGLQRMPHVIDRLKKVLEDAGKALEQGAVVVVEESRHRARRLSPGT